MGFVEVRCGGTPQGHDQGLMMREKMHVKRMRMIATRVRDSIK